MRREWILALVRTFLAIASYALGAGLSLFPQLALKFQVALGAAVGGLTLVAEYLTNIRPARHLQEVSPYLCDQFTAAFWDFLVQRVQVQPRMHVMIPRRTWRWLGLRRYFVTWWSRGMDNQPDVNIVFPINQGVQGECLLRKRPIYAPAVKAGTGFRFPKRLLPQAIDIEAFISYPIYEPPRAGQRQSGKLIGVFTLDSKTPNAYALLIDVAIRATVHEKMEGIAILIGRIYH